MIKSSKTLMLVSASIVSIGLAMPAIAADQQAGTVEQKVNDRGPEVTKEEIKQGWEDSKKAVSDTAEDISQAVEEKYDDIKATMVDDDNGPQTVFKNQIYAGASSARSLIGKRVKDQQSAEVATVHDIIVDQGDDASLLILSDDGFFGMGGKLVALKYDKVVNSTDRAETLKTVSKDTIKDVAEFSYTPKAGKTSLMSTKSVSLAKALKGTLVDTQQKKLASIENVIMKDGKADKLIVVFDQILGLGGDAAAFNFKDVSILQTEDQDIKFQLSAAQARAFKNYKKNIKK